MTEKLTERQKHVLHFILKTDEDVGIDELVRRLDVSRRTIQRNVNAIQSYLKSYDLHLRVTPMRIFIEGHSDNLARMLKETGKLPSTEALTPKDREFRVAMDLLMEQGPMKLGYFGKQLNITPASLSHNLDDVYQLLHSHGLHLIRRRGYGVEVHGDEEIRREALAELIYDQIDLPDLMTIFRLEDEPKTNHPVFLWFSKWFDSVRIETVRQVLREELEILNPPLDEAAFFGFMLHVLLTCTRIAQGASLPPTTRRGRVESLDEQICVRVLERLLPDSIDIDEEALYLAKHLRGAKVSMTDDTRILPLHITSMDLAYQILKYLDVVLGIRFVTDGDLLAGLAQHLEPAVHRMTTGLVIRNPLLEEIRRRYSTFFAAMRSASQHVLEPYGLQVPDAEIGYLTMHLGAAYERKRATNTWSTRIVCPNGISSAQLLASRINKEFPQVKIASIDSIYSIEDTACDFIVCTVPLENRDTPVVTVSPFLTKEDVYTIQSMLEQLEETSLSMPYRGNGSSIPMDQHFQADAEYLSDRVNIHHVPVSNMRDLIHQIANDLVAAGEVHDREALIEAIVQRELLGSIVLPGKQLSVLHARTSTLSSCQIAVYRLSQSITVPGVAHTEESIDTVLVLLALVDEHPSIIRLLGRLSSALVMDEDMVDTLRTASKQDVQQRIRKAMYRTEE
jgi:mannitol operon transcriptional antiterminator